MSDQEVCEHCNTKFIYCPWCGTQFCANCGSDVHMGPVNTESVLDPDFEDVLIFSQEKTYAARRRGN